MAETKVKPVVETEIKPIAKIEGLGDIYSLKGLSDIDSLNNLYDHELVKAEDIALAQIRSGAKSPISTNNFYVAESATNGPANLDSCLNLKSVIHFFSTNPVIFIRDSKIQNYPCGYVALLHKKDYFKGLEEFFGYNQLHPLSADSYFKIDKSELDIFEKGHLLFEFKKRKIKKNSGLKIPTNRFSEDEFTKWLFGKIAGTYGMFKKEEQGVENLELILPNYLQGDISWSPLFLKNSESRFEIDCSNNSFKNSMDYLLILKKEGKKEQAIDKEKQAILDFYGRLKQFNQSK